MSGLLELAERVEALSAPDRELDTEVWEAIEPQKFSAAFWNVRSSLNRDIPESEKDATARQRMRDAPAYTASLDAATTLVPRGWHSSINTTEGAELRGSAAVRDRDGGPSFTSAAATPTLALCAAALRARATS